MAVKAELKAGILLETSSGSGPPSCFSVKCPALESPML